jgi:hypothetical protein
VKATGDHSAGLIEFHNRLIAWNDGNITDKGEKFAIGGIPPFSPKVHLAPQKSLSARGKFPHRWAPP